MEDNYKFKYLKYKKKYLNLIKQFGGNEHTCEVVLRYVMNGTLTRPVENSEIGEYFTTIFPHEISAIPLSEFDKISAELSAASMRLGNHLALQDEVRQLTESGVLTEANNQTYKGKSAIHNIGNYASEASLIAEINDGILKWYIDYNIPFTKKYLFTETAKNQSKQNMKKQIQDLTQTEFTDFITLYFYDNISNIPSSFLILLKKIADNIDDKEKIRRIQNKDIKLIIDRTNTGDSHNIITILDTMALIDKYVRFTPSAKNNLCSDVLSVIYEIYEEPIYKFITFYYRHIDRLNRDLYNPELQRLGIAFMRLKIIDEKYQELHNLDTLVSTLEIRGYPLTYQQRIRTEDSYSKQFNKNISIINVTIDQIVFLMIQRIKRIINEYIDFCFENYKS